MIDMNKARRESIRWYLLLTLYNAHPIGAYEELILSTIQGIYPDVSRLEMQRELEYLSDRELITLDKQPDGRWHADLNRYGVDVVEYTVAIEPGIARPARG